MASSGAVGVPETIGRAIYCPAYCCDLKRTVRGKAPADGVLNGFI